MGARNLHLLATREGLGPLRGQEVAVDGSLPGLDWTLRFYDPVVAPALGLISEDAGPAFAEVRGALGVTTVVYHVVAQPGSGLTPHHAGHVGAGLASGHTAAARDFETIRTPGAGAGRRWSTRWSGAAARGPPPRAGAAGAGDRAPQRGGGGAGRRGASPDPDEVRKALLAAVGGRTQWTRPP